MGGARAVGRAAPSPAGGGNIDSCIGMTVGIGVHIAITVAFGDRKERGIGGRLVDASPA